MYTTIGTVILFHTIRNVNAGEELCISYIETKTLFDNDLLRNDVLQRDFYCNCSRCNLTAEDKEILQNEDLVDPRMCEVTLFCSFSCKRERLKTFLNVLVI